MKERAQTLRQNMTDAENRIWYYLRNRRLGGYKFVREHVIGHYIADFVCREKKLIIEIDGGQHMDAIEYDLLRTKDLESRGYRVLRIWNHEVFKNIQGVMDSVLNLLEAVPTPNTLIPSPSPSREKGADRAN
jgi:very-short-patch-repair endonuclease